ncbi:MAG: hypothetical protein ACYDIA_25960 [Candidatus Humimicrobiaceae bacterium]
MSQSRTSPMTHVADIEEQVTFRASLTVKIVLSIDDKVLSNLDSIFPSECFICSIKYYY